VVERGSASDTTGTDDKKNPHPEGVPDVCGVRFWFWRWFWHPSGMRYLFYGDSPVVSFAEPRSTTG